MADITIDESVTAGRMYQYANGSFLPDSSQPNPQDGYKIVTNQYTPHNATRYCNVLVECGNAEQLKDGKRVFYNRKKDLPVLYTNRIDCCGCFACHAICPASAIFMRPDEEGFLYPVVDAETCLRCYQCISVCPIKR